MNMRKKILLAAMFLTVACAMYVQAQPVLAVLPFTGDNPEDAATLAEFFSFQDEIQRAFTVVPRIPDHIQNMMREHQFQRSGLTDSDTLSELGKQMNADYVLAGHITSLGTGADRSNLLLITVIHVEEFRQAAGDYREFRRIEDTVSFLPDMAQRIVAVSRQDSSQLRRLAVLPFNPLSSGIDERDAEVLAQMLATDIANSGRFAVFPRTSAIETVMREHNIQRSGMTDPASIRYIGYALNAQYVLSANARRLGADTFFSASVLHITGGNQQVGSMQRYRTVSDGLSLMPALARELVADRAGAIGEFVRVEGGTFLMGSPEGAWGSRDWERPVRSVTVSGFYMSRHPVTQGQWREIMGTTVQQQRDMGYRDQGSDPQIAGIGDNQPMYNVNWYEAIEFANRKSLRAGLTPVYTITGAGNNRTVTWNRNANGYRLPTEAEWEFAARGGHGSPRNFMFSGSNTISDVAWYNQSVGSTQDVGTLRPNSLGLYDMSGNVWEWIYDWRTRYYPSAAQTNPTGAPSGTIRVVRGGSWASPATDVRSTTRGAQRPSTRGNALGFRLVSPQPSNSFRHVTPIATQSSPVPQAPPSVAASPASGSVIISVPSDTGGAGFRQEGTATGELSGSLAARHPSLPIGSTVTVTNAATGIEIAVTIVGRIPPSANRIIDLSHDALFAIGLRQH